METNENIFKESGKNSSQSINQDSLMRNSDYVFFNEFDVEVNFRNFWPMKLTNFISLFLEKDFAGHHLNFQEIIMIYRKTTFDKDFKPKISKVHTFPS
jgi:hypothetical protein